MFLLLRNIDTNKDDLVNISAIQTAHGHEGFFRDEQQQVTRVVWNTDNRYGKKTTFDTQQESYYAIPFSEFLRLVDHQVFDAPNINEGI